MSTPLNPALIPPGVSGPATPASAAGTATAAPTGPSFGDTFAQRAAGVTFSNHAMQRVQRRGIEVDGQTLQRLDSAVQKAAAKGSRDAVVLVDQTAFVVSVANKTVITAVGREHMRDHVFTNIDSAVVG